VTQINDSLIEFDEAVKNPAKVIRNKQAYLIGVIKRYLSVTEKERAGGAPRMGHNLTPLVLVSTSTWHGDSFRFTCNRNI
jgi:hypothetical protein